MTNANAGAGVRLRDPLTWTARHALAIFVVYCLSHALLRFALSNAVGVDDVVEALHSEALSLGYNPRQPPLYTWLLWLVRQPLGIGLGCFLFLKYLSVGLFLWLSWLAAKRALRDDVLAALSTLSLLALYQIGWNIHEGFTHSLTMLVAIAATFYLFVRLTDRASPALYVALGVALGCGLLAKYGFSAFLLCLFGGALVDARARRTLLSPWMPVSLAIAAAVAAPYAVWLFGVGGDLGRIAQTTMTGADAGAGWLDATGLGLATLAGAVGGFLSPLFVILLLLFPRSFLPLGLPSARRCGVAEGDVDWTRVLGAMTAIGLVAPLLGVLVFGVTNYRERWMHPLLIYAPLWMFTRIQTTGPSPRRLTVLLAAIAGLSVVAAGWRVAERVVGPPLCGKCRLLAPYDDLADALRAAGFERGAIVAGDEHIVGNLAIRFPKARIFSLHSPRHVPRETGEPGQCAIVWDAARMGDRLPHGAIRLVGAQQDAFGPSAELRVRIAPPLAMREAAEKRWRYVISEGVGRCR